MLKVVVTSRRKSPLEEGEWNQWAVIVAVAVVRRKS
jgi:hypothetical protein